MRLLLSRDINVNSRYKATQLCNAAKVGHSAMVLFLIGDGAQVNMETVSGNTPRTHVVSCTVSETNMRALKILIQHRANIHSAYTVSASLEGFGYSNSNIASVLLNNGADPTLIVRHTAYTPVLHAIFRGKRGPTRLPLERVAKSTGEI